MRRTIFGKPPDVELNAPARALAREALSFDVRDHSGSVDQTLAERRIASWTFAPWLMLSAHIVLVISSLLQAPPPVGFGVKAVPLVLAMLLDGATGGLMLLWRRLQFAPHTIARLMCFYVAATGLLWTAGSASTGALYANDASLITLTMAAGFFVRSIVAVPSPPLAVINA